jgi:predicted transcriptional regulator
MADTNQHQQVVPEHMRLIDFQQYLENRGLQLDEPRGLESDLNVSEINKRVEDEAVYQALVLEQAFAAHDRKPDSKADFLETIGSKVIVLHCANGSVEAEMKVLATHCDTVYAFVSSYKLYKDGSSHGMVFSLEEFSLESVCAFVDTLSGRNDPQNLPADSIVECCQIAHYLQCNSVLDPIVQILIDAVDADNCKSLLELADQLSLHLLFERSLSHMMQSLEETRQVWEDLPLDLRDRVDLMKKALQSSILTRRNSRLYFTSLDEYLAMFAETLTYQRERLLDAKQRQEEESGMHFVRSRGWQYNQSQLENQERRFRRLEQVMELQKKAFSDKDGRFRINKRGVKANRQKT